VFGGYAAVSLVFFGLRIAPHPGRDLIGSGPDPEIFVWSLAWWPHAIAAWTNPFVSHAVYAPGGINLAWATSVPGLALPLAPVTALFGPVVAYNVAAVLMPALAAWTAFALCRRLTGSVWASLVGGYLFGFSSYILGHLVAGHLNLTAVFLLPLVALVIVRFTDGELSARGLSWRLGVLLAAQLSISTEIAATLTLCLVGGLGLGLLLMRDRRAQLRALTLPTVGAYGVAAVIAAPLVVYAFIGFVGSSLSIPFSTDLANLVVPTPLTGLGGEHFAATSVRFRSGVHEAGLYLGAPLLLVVAHFAWHERRSPSARWLVAAVLVLVVLSLGASLRIDGDRIVTLPWAAVQNLPVLNNVLPARLGVFVWLLAAVISARWIATTRGATAVVVPLAVIATLAPAPWRGNSILHPTRSAFFTTGAYRTCLPRGETLAVFPYGSFGDSMLWQAESGFAFNLAGGYLRYDPPATYANDPTAYKLNVLSNQPYLRPGPAELLAFAHRHHVDRILSVPSAAYPDTTQMHAFGAVQVLDGMAVAPACGHTSLAGDTRPAG